MTDLTQPNHPAQSVTAADAQTSPRVAANRTTSRGSGTDWTAARDFWVAMPPHTRNFELVAREFGISSARVRFVARRDNWRPLAEDVDRQANAQVTRRIVRSHADRVQKTLGIIDAALDEFDEQLVEKAREAKLRDIGELVRTANLQVGEATDRMAFAEVQDALGATVKLALEFIPVERRDAFLARWRGLFGSDADDSSNAGEAAA